MIKRNLGLISALNMLLDGFLTFVCYFIARYLRYGPLHGVIRDRLSDGSHVLAAALYSIVFVLVLYVLKLYKPGRIRRESNACLRVVFVNGICTVCFAAFLYVLRIVDFSRLALVIFWALSSALVVVKRVAIRGLLARVRMQGYNLRHVVIVGDGHLAQQYVEDIRNNPHLGIKIDGYVSAVTKPELGRRLGSYEELDRILQSKGLDELIVALEPHEIQFMPRILKLADKEGVPLSLIPFFNDYIPSQPTIEALGNTRLIDMRATPMDHLGWAMVKRTMDIVGSVLLIILTSPVMLAVAVGVRLSSPGPVLFTQMRMGKNKKTFRMLKFRSMRVTDTEHTGWSTPDDPRKTRFGSLIRKYSLDELPQFFNVLKGEMSLVGPRPETVYHVSHFKEEVPRYLVRQQVRPGITGWAQINGLRGDTSIDERVKYDIWYIENWSVWLDVRILLMTVFGGMVNQEEFAQGGNNPKR